MGDSLTTLFAISSPKPLFVVPCSCSTADNTLNIELALDCGSFASMADEKIRDLPGRIRTSDSPTHAITANGEDVWLTEIKTVTLLFGDNNVPLEIDFWIFPSLVFPFLLGAIDIVKHGVIINAETSTIRIANNDFPLLQKKASLPSFIPEDLPVSIEAKTSIPPFSYVPVPVIIDAPSMATMPIVLTPNMTHQHSDRISWSALHTITNPVKPFICVANHSDKEIVIDSGARIATACVLPDNGAILSVSNSDNTSNDDSSLSDLVNKKCDVKTLSEPLRLRLLELLKKSIHQPLVLDLDTSRPPITGIKHSIALSDETPVRAPNYTRSFQESRETRAELRKLEDVDFIRPIVSPWSAPILWVRKADGTRRMCIDYTALNAKTIPDVYPMPNIDHIMAQLATARFFTKLDLARGYWQVAMDEKDIEKTAFSDGSKLWGNLRMPFGLSNAPATFQRLMNDILFLEIQDGFVLVYLDDILIFSMTADDHLAHIARVFEKLHARNVQVKLPKCEFAQPKVKYLGFIIGEGTISADPDDIKPILDCLPPKTVRQLQRFLGNVNYYRKFIPDLSSIIEPLNRLTDKSSKWKWSDECKEAFAKCKSLLTSNLVLDLPRVSSSSPFIVYSDASDVAHAAVLSQVPEGETFDLKAHYRPIAFYSKGFKPSERKKSATEREMLGCLRAIERFRYLLESDVPFILVTDHEALKYLLPSPTQSKHFFRWTLRLIGLRFKVYHRKGSDIPHVDSLTRSPFFFENGTQVDHFETPPPPKDVILVSLVTQAGEGEHTEEFAELDMIKLQSEDPYIASILKWIRNGFKQEDLDDSFKKFKKRFSIVNDLLVYSSKKFPNRIFVPKVARDSLIALCHNDKLLGAHTSAKKTLLRIEPQYFWPKMEEDVRKFCSSCQVCQLYAPVSRGKYGELHPINADCVWQKIGIDVAGPLNPEVDGYKYILVIVDYFSRYAIAEPLRTMLGGEIARAIFNSVFCKFGIPKTIISDRAANLNQGVVSNLCRFFDAKKRASVSYKPDTDGAAERLIGSLKSRLRKIVYASPTLWPYSLAPVLMSYNSTIHDATGHSPHMMIFGREPRLLPSFLGDWPNGDLPEDGTDKFRELASDYTHELVETLRKAHLVAHENMRSYQTVLKSFYDRKHTELDLKVGDWIFWVPPQLWRDGSSFSPIRKGPFMVVKVLEKGVIDFANPLDKNTVYRTSVKLVIPATAPPKPSEYSKLPQVPRFTSITSRVDPLVRETTRSRLSAFEHANLAHGLNTSLGLYAAARNRPNPIQYEIDDALKLVKMHLNEPRLSIDKTEKDAIIARITSAKPRDLETSIVPGLVTNFWPYVD